MQPTIFKFIFKYSKKQQIGLLALTMLSFPFLYLLLDLPKTIVNEAIGGSVFLREVVGVELQQIPYLMSLCAVFLLLVLINGAFKYSVNVYRGVVGERMQVALALRTFFSRPAISITAILQNRSR
jgi:putative ABC transport system ATP-binding protein